MVRIAIAMVIALVSVACSQVSTPSTASPSRDVPAPAPTTSTTSSATPRTTPEASPPPTTGIAFRALDLPADYRRGGAEAVDGTTAVGWVQVGMNDERPAVWDTTTGTLRVLEVPAAFVHASGDTFVRLNGVSGTTAVGTGILGVQGKRGQARPLAWDTQTGDVRTLDIPAEFTQAEAHAISGTTAVGQVWTADGEVGAAVAWDTETGAVWILEMPADYACANPLAVSGETVVGIRCDRDDALPLVWSPLTAVARDLDLLPGTQDGVPRAVDGTTAVGNCCFGEEGTPLPLLWDTATGSVRQLALPAPFVNGRADGVSGTVVIGSTGSTSVVWDLGTGNARVLPSPVGYDESSAVHSVSGRTIVGSACAPPSSASDDPRCVAAAWTLP